MKYFLILLCGLFIFTSCGNPANTNEQKTGAPTQQSDTEIPTDLTYNILEETSNKALSKCNLDLQLSRKINKNELTALANKLRSTRDQYNHLWIFYTLEGMKVGSGAWATTHFTPDLKVEILGATAEEEKELNKLSKNVDGGTTIGQWFEQQATSATYVYYEKNNKFYMKTIFKDKSSMESEIKKTKVKNGLRLNDIGNTHGEYFLIASNGNLEFYNKEGKRFATGQTVK